MNRPVDPQRFPTEHFINRELSLLQFQRRVLAQAADSGVPLLERLRFLCIVSSNLDEFFEIRVSGIKEQIRLGSRSAGNDGLVPIELLDRVSKEVHEIIAEQYGLLNEEILPALEGEGIVFLRRSLWSDAQRAWIREYFLREVMPVLTPIGLDPAHPFPRVLNKSLNFAIELEGLDAFGRDSGAAIVQAPRALPRVIRLPNEICDQEYSFVFLSSVLHAHVGELFSGMHVLGCYQFRVTRNSDLFVDEEEVKDLRASLKGELQQRHFGDAVRLEVADNCSEDMAAFLLQHFHLTRQDLYRTPGIVNLVRLMQVPDWVSRPDLNYPPFLPGLPKALEKRHELFDAIRRQDVLLHHPFQSFGPVIELLRAAADDPQVVAIKMTVYRTGTDSVLMENLARAAQKGKEVTVVLELMAGRAEARVLERATRSPAVVGQAVAGLRCGTIAAWRPVAHVAADVAACARQPVLMRAAAGPAADRVGERASLLGERRVAAQAGLVLVERIGIHRDQLTEHARPHRLRMAARAPVVELGLVARAAGGRIERGFLWRVSRRGRPLRAERALPVAVEKISGIRDGNAGGQNQPAHQEPSQACHLRA